MTTLPFDAVFFDMDGTLVNTEPYWLEAEKSLMDEFGAHWTLEDQAYCLGGPLSKMANYMWEKSGGAKSPEYFGIECVRRVAALFAQGINFMPGAFEILEELQALQIPMALVSASPRILVDSTVKMLEKDYFRTTIGSEDVSQTKPSPEGYLLAATRLHVSIERSLIFEDSHTGIAAAQASGAGVIAIPHLNAIAEQGRTRIVGSLSGLSVADIAHLYIPKTN
jgi:HAD superfamily hydrolase (TIGR01509 family)